MLRAKKGSKPGQPLADPDPEQVVDLIHLKLCSDRGLDQTYSVFAAHVSIVVCGWDNVHWTAWAFADTRCGSEEDEGDEDEDDELIVKEDYLATDGLDGPTLDADRPIWDPRAYWLRIVAIRMDTVLKEWLYIVHTIEASLSHSVRISPHTMVCINER